MTRGVTIFGAGVAGLTVATEFVRRGAEVRLVDPAGAPSEHACSWWAGGMLAPFCEGETAEEPVVRIGQEAARWWQAAGVDVVGSGSLVVTLARDRRELDRFARRTERYVRLDRAALADLEPGLAGRFDTALFFPDEAHLDPRSAMGRLVEGLHARGVAITAEADPVGTVIHCRGLHARDVLPELRGVRGEMAVLRAPGVAISRPVRLLHPRHPLYIVPRSEGIYMLGATQVESASRRPATLRSVVELLNAAYALDPAFGEAEVLEIGADARPAFPDNLPRITRCGGDIHVNGLFRHGFLLAPALARMTAEWILEDKQPELMR